LRHPFTVFTTQTSKIGQKPPPAKLGAPRAATITTMAKLTTDDLLDAFADMTLVEVTDFVRKFENKFGVTASTVTTLLPPQPTEDLDEVEQTEFDVILQDAGAKKVHVIKVVREIANGLTLKDAKYLVDDAPSTVLNKVTKEVAEEARGKLVAAGAAATIE
jgi:large subunit ribosomal protein L7/L12